MKSYLPKEIKSNMLLLDVRTKEEWDFVHIQSSLHIPLDVLEENLDKIDKSKEVVVFCHHGYRAMIACDILLKKGFNVAYLEGGIDSWAEQVDSNMKRY